MSSDILTVRIPEEYARQRLDAVLVELFPDYSRSRLQQWIKNGHVLVNGKAPKAKDKVLGDEQVEIHLDSLPMETECQPQAIPLDVVYQDDDLLVINKPVGLVVHPAAGHADGTLQNALLHYDPRLAEVPRAGIVHRLDKETSGLLVVARNLKSHKSLVDQLQARTVQREYRAIVLGVMTAGGTVEQAIGRNPRDRKRQAVREDGKEAITHYRVIQRFRGHTLIKVNLETGRTHQIRVHMAHIHYPLVGDQVYGGRLKFPRGASEPLKLALRQFQRQALHAGRLALVHPVTGKKMSWKADLPDDMCNLLQALEQDMEEVDDWDEYDLD
ncbi:MAG: 23S rRNA pseudouridine(1911/1915/1917) synthase RluD [Gammaproteobacteria bacterium]|nr:23S rRNA pseudouridine(1911/1915/1917) synthase RluD [Gammaproteobacteria bacterium]